MNPYYNALSTGIKSTIETATFSGTSGCGIARYAVDSAYDNKGANLAYTCYIRKNQAPNYFLLFLNSTSELIKTLISFVTDLNGLSMFSTSGLSAAGGVPCINLRDEVLKGTVIIDWNTDRNLTQSTFKNLANWFIETFNELVDYVIESGSSKATANFYNKWMSLFCNVSSKKPYAHTIYTLMLPAIVNVLSRAGKGDTAHKYMGYVSKSSKVVPFKAGSTQVWWGKKYDDTNYIKETRTLGETDIRENVNNKLVKGDYCNPFSYVGKEGGINNNYSLAVHPSPKYTDSYTPVFTTDKYKNNKDELLSKTYLTVDGDYVETTGEKGWVPLTDNDLIRVLKPFPVYYICDLLNKKTVVRNDVDAKGYCYTLAKEGNGSILDFSDYSPEGLVGLSYDKHYRLVRNTGYTIGNTYNATTDRCDNVYLDPNSDEWATYIDKNLVGRKQVYSRLPGSIKSKDYPKSYISKYNMKETLTFFAPAYDVFYIHPATIRCWMYLINTQEAITFIASEFSKAITTDMTMMHYISKMFRNYSGPSFGMWSLPLGPLCLRPVSQYVLPHLNYYTDYLIQDNNIKSNPSASKTYLQYALENIIQSNTFTEITEKSSFSLTTPNYGYDLFDLVGYFPNGRLNTTDLSALFEDDGGDQNTTADISRSRIIVRLSPIDTSLQNSYILIGQVFIPVFQISIDTNNIKVQYNDCQKDLSYSRLSTSKQLLKNKAYIYMTKATSDNLGTYTVESFPSQKDTTGKYMPYFKLKFNANEIKDKPVLIKKRSYN
jgi:hypothetical protein